MNNAGHKAAHKAQGEQVAVGKELQWPQFQVIEPKNTLKKKALIAGNPREALERATQRAERAMDQLSAQFPQWMKSESQRLFLLREEIATKGPTPERLDRLFASAHDIKGQAITFGYPLAAMVGKMLADLIEHAPDPCLIPLPVIDQHVNTIRVLVREDVRGNGNAQTKKLLQGLHVLNHTTLKKLAGNKAST